MNKKIYSVSTFMLLSVIALMGQTNTVGNDKDAHGCRASAGYTFSIIKNDCVRLFEQEIQLSEVNPTGTSTSVSAVIFSGDMKQAEVFIPGSTGGTILSRTGTENNYIWKKGKVSLLQKNKGYILKNGKKVIFSSETQTGNMLKQ